MRTFLFGPRTRVRIRRGRFPLDSALVGRAGVIVELDDVRPLRYIVVLDGELDPREFDEEELEPVSSNSGGPS